MNFERPESSVESVDARKRRISNEIQTQIMSLVCSPDQGEECFIDWINNNALEFDEIFNEVLNRDSNYLDKWDRNEGGERDRSLDFFMSELDNRKKRAA